MTIPLATHDHPPGQIVQEGVDCQPIAIAGPRSVGVEARLDEDQFLRLQQA
jgi:hypothetical protein